MKRGWLAGALLAALVAVSLWNVAKLDRLTGEMNGLLAQAERYAEEGDWKKAKEKTQEAKKRWDRSGFYLHITLDHQVTDDISVSFGEVSEFIECEEGGEYSAANARLMEEIRLMGELQKPKMENLL